MKEDFVTYDLAVRLKDKGFKEKCIAYYWEKINEHTPSFVFEDKMLEDGLCLLDLLSNHNRVEWSPFIDAPTISQVLKWLFYEKQLFVNIDCNICDKFGLFFTIYKKVETTWEACGSDENYYNKPEEAAIAGIEYVLNEII